jgi:hypothetical protein
LCIVKDKGKKIIINEKYIYLQVENGGVYISCPKQKETNGKK